MHWMLEANKTNLSLASGVEGFGFLGGNISNGVIANITNNGAIKPFFATRLNFEPYARIPIDTKAGALTTADVPQGTFAVIHDTTGGTYKLYANISGTLRSVGLV